MQSFVEYMHRLFSHSQNRVYSANQKIYIDSFLYLPVPAPTAMNCGMYTGNVQDCRMDKEAKMILDSNVFNDSINCYVSLLVGIIA